LRSRFEKGGIYTNYFTEDKNKFEFKGYFIETYVAYLVFHEHLRILSQVERYIANDMTLLLCSHPSSSVDRGKYPRSGHNRGT